MQVMDKHQSIPAKQHIETRFVETHAEVVVLPTLAPIKRMPKWMIMWNGDYVFMFTRHLECRLCYACA